jgi:hypothetical protein
LAAKAKTISYALRIPVLILGAVSTIILGCQIPGSECQFVYQALVRNVALVISAASTVLVGLASFWNAEAYWLRNRVKLAQLEALREEYVMSGFTTKSEPEGIDDDIINRYLSIVDTTPGWMETLAKKKREQSAATS